MRLHKLWGIAITATLSVASAQSPIHTGYWNKRTDKGSAFACHSATSAGKMDEILISAGWPVGQGVPAVNWGTDMVVVVAPSKFEKTATLAFWGLIREGDTVVLDYGWKKITSSERVSANSISLGSVGEGYRATIVVAFRRGLYAGLKFVCRDRGIVD